MAWWVVGRDVDGSLIPVRCQSRDWHECRRHVDSDGMPFLHFNSSGECSDAMNEAFMEQVTHGTALPSWMNPPTVVDDSAVACESELRESLVSESLASKLAARAASSSASESTESTDVTLPHESSTTIDGPVSSESESASLSDTADIMANVLDWRGKHEARLARRRSAYRARKARASRSHEASGPRVAVSVLIDDIVDMVESNSGGLVDDESRAVLSSMWEQLGTAVDGSRARDLVRARLSADGNAWLDEALGLVDDKYEFLVSEFSKTFDTACSMSLRVNDKSLTHLARLSVTSSVDDLVVLLADMWNRLSDDDRDVFVRSASDDTSRSVLTRVIRDASNVNLPALVREVRRRQRERD